MSTKGKTAFFVVFLLAGCFLFCWFVYPTPWDYDYSRSDGVYRTNRFSGVRQRQKPLEQKWRYFDSPKKRKPFSNERTNKQPWHCLCS